MVEVAHEQSRQMHDVALLASAIEERIALGIEHGLAVTVGPWYQSELLYPKDEAGQFVLQFVAPLQQLGLAIRSQSKYFKIPFAKSPPEMS